MAVLFTLSAIAAVDEDLYLNVLSVILIVLPVCGWTVAGVLVWTARQAPDVASLVNRADDAVTLAIASSVGAIAGFITLARLFGIVIPGRPVLVLLGFALVTVSVPAIGWLGVWRDVWLPMVRNRRSAE